MQDLAEKWRSIGLDRDYSAVDLSGLEPDVEGWGSGDPIFAYVVENFRPEILIEVGTWKGASLLTMANAADRIGLATRFICVDTWLGSNDSLWAEEELRKSLMLVGGYPTMYRQFIYNILAARIAQRVFPLPMTSTSAYHLLKRLDVRPDAVYIDAGHEEDEVAIDIKLYYDLLRPNGVLFGDDYDPSWPGVVAAAGKFAASRNLPLMAFPGKFMIRKPGPGA